MKKTDIPGLRIFLITLIDLISIGKKENCEQVKSLLATGVATKMYSSYATFFEKNNFNMDNIQCIDEYFKQWAGCTDEQEKRKYNCDKTEGLQLIIKLALNEIF